MVVMAVVAVEVEVSGGGGVEGVCVRHHETGGWWPSRMIAVVSTFEREWRLGLE